MKSKFSKSLYAAFAILKYSNSKSKSRIFNTDTIKQLESIDFLAKLKENPEAIYIDIRTAIEYKLGHHPRSINIDFLWGFEEQISKIDHTKTIFLNCETAHRSPYAVYLLKKMGFTKIYDLKGGFMKIRSKI